MTRWMATALCALLLAPGLLACRSSDAPAADDPVSERAAEGAADETSAEDPAGSEGAEAPEAAADAGEGGGTEAEPQATPTPDPTVVALARSFEPPIKGDPNAPVMVYEFSDYL